MKKNIVRALSVALVLTAMSGIVAFAETRALGDGGEAKLYCTYSSGMRKVYAATNRGSSSELAGLWVVTTYQDGSQDTYRSGIAKQNQVYTHGYEWSEDYKSTHKLFRYSNDCYATEYLSDY